MKQLLMVFIGGGLGAVSRYGLSNLITANLDTRFPAGTVIVNLIGCFIIGLLFEIFRQTSVSPALKGLFLTGFLGAFTTFSTFSLETVNLFHSQEIKTGLTYLAVSNIAGVVLAGVGIWVGDWAIRIMSVDV